jgi:hypothetical protein
MTSKLKIKLGALEVEYEGTDDFIKSDLLPLLTALNELHIEIPANDEDDATNLEGDDSKHASTEKFSTSAIAQKLGATSGPDLVKAAVACLAFSHKKDTVSRKEILKEMQTATHFYKKTYMSNLGGSLGSLVASKVLNPIGEDTYSLNKPTREALETLLAN